LFKKDTQQLSISILFALQQAEFKMETNPKPPPKFLLETKHKILQHGSKKCRYNSDLETAGCLLEASVSENK
jgi:hypothetical protein